MRTGSWISAVVLSTLAAAVVLSAGAGDARAEAEVQATVAASTGYTDNYNAQADDSTGSAFMSVEPGVQLFISSPNTVQRLAYRLGINFFLADSGSTSFSNNLSWDLSHTISDFTESLFSLGVNHVSTDTAAPVATDPTGGVNALPLGASQFLGFSAGIGLSHQISDLWRTTQGVNAVYTSPVDSSGFVTGATFNGSAGLGIDRDLESGNMGLNLGGSYIFIEGLGMAAPVGQPAGDQKQVLFTAVGRYTRPLSPLWTMDLAAGAAGAALADDVGALDFYPTGNAALTWQEDKHSASIAYNHGVALNPFLRTTILADDVVVRGSLPLAQSRWLLSGSVGYQHASTLTFDAAMDGTSSDVFSVDVAVAYEISPTMNLGGRYQLAYQAGDSEAVPDLVRNAISVVFTMTYPDRTKTVLPFRQPLKMLRDPTLGEPERPRRGGF